MVISKKMEEWTLKKARKDKRRNKRDLKKRKKRSWAAKNLKRKRITLGLKIKKN